MSDLLTAAALVLVIEGLLWSIAPGTMRRAAVTVLALEPARLRVGGVACAAAGVLGVWLVRG